MHGAIAHHNAGGDSPEPVCAIVQQQPQPRINPNGCMSVPIGIPNCPRGLEYLASIDQLLVQQKVELFEVFTGFETNNKYTTVSAKTFIGLSKIRIVVHATCVVRVDHWI